MAKTYLDITNLVLQDANEVQLTETSFTSSRGLQSFTKEAVNRALMDIATSTPEWNWLKTGTASSPNTVATVATTQWYEFKTVTAQSGAYSSIDFDTFFLDNGTDRYDNLQKISYDEWNNHLRETDEHPNDLGGVPKYVIETNDSNQFGLSPVPDDVYTISFRSWEDANVLVNALDTLPFPDRYYNVLVARAKYYLWTFKENDFQTQISNRDYADGLNRMKEQLTTPKGRKFRLV
ncbi:MAG: hypothetical protein V3S69_00920 [Dehalococcoidales bacterium]